MSSFRLEFDEFEGAGAGRMLRICAWNSPGGDLDNPRRYREAEIGPRSDHPAEEGLPDRMRLLTIEQSNSAASENLP
jgi:hypothetical protein